MYISYGAEGLHIMSTFPIYYTATKGELTVNFIQCVCVCGGGGGSYFLV